MGDAIHPIMAGVAVSIGLLWSVQRVGNQLAKFLLELISRARVKCAVLDTAALALVAFAAFEYHLAFCEMKYSRG